jgi:hypothetical protein
MTLFDILMIFHKYLVLDTFFLLKYLSLLLYINVFKDSF